MTLPNPFLYADVLIQTPRATRKVRLHYAATTAPAVYNHVQAIANYVHLVIGGAFATVMPAECKVAGTVARYITDSVDLEAPSTEAAITGTMTAIIEALDGTDHFDMPDEACLIFRKITGHGGRSKRGRIFLPGISEVVNDGGRIYTGAKAAVISIAELLTAPVAVTYTDGEEVEPAFAANLNLRLFDQKNSMLVPVMKCVALDIIGSRIDRRKPLPLQVLVPPA